MKKSNISKLLASFLSAAVMCGTVCYSFVGASAEDATEPNYASGPSLKTMQEWAANEQYAKGFNNGNFEDGLNYWGSNQSNFTLSDADMGTIEVKTEDGNSYLHMETKSGKGIASAPFTLEGFDANKNLSLRFRYKLNTSGSGTTENVQIILVQGSYNTAVAESLAYSANLAVNDEWTVATLANPSKNMTLSDKAQYFTVNIFYNGTNDIQLDIDDIEVVEAVEEKQDQVKGYLKSLDGKTIYHWTDGKLEFGDETGITLDKGYNFNPARTRVVAPVEGLKNLDFSQGLKYFMPNQSSNSPYTLANNGVKLEKIDGVEVLTINGNGKGYNGFVTNRIEIPQTAKNKTICMEFYYKCSGGINVSVNAGLKTADGSAVLSWSAGTNVKRENFTLKNDIAPKSIGENDWLTVSVQNPNKTEDTYVSVKDIKLYYDDIGGITVNNKALRTSILGAPLDKEQGDANADGDFNICDLVTANDYINNAESTSEIYFSAAKFTNQTTESELTQNDIDEMRLSLLGK